jgi:hypothetical protein
MIDPDCVDDLLCALKKWDSMSRVSIDDDVICELDVVDDLTFKPLGFSVFWKAA